MKHEDSILAGAFGFFLAFITMALVVNISERLEHHTKPYTIAYETITIQDKINCLQDPNCNDIILVTDLPQRPEGK